ncbi:ABC transporter ATP-binding protein [Acidaminobacter hydrogenoformans]|uniref:ATP-binding cassette, subfamily B n=1 Tax=Acidaminobacter hydrogenoformans DSM 2784 TaxID=1120920 RepID=A0A1G5S056_9FIRM|nr:ABC transporter ATP-binding protein [Acidaminobacter hydrogenoformans]SCZ79360.1 ATP-binding cassette, subfamily B [Acidaminobacter hydrogenoformans DSM 2784]
MIRLFKYAKPFKFLVAAVVLLVFLQTMADLYLPTLMSDIIDKGVMRGDTGVILSTGGSMLVVAGLGGLAAVLSSFLSAKVAVGFGRILRNEVFSHVSSFSEKEIDQFGTATLITRSTNDITQIQNVVIMMLRMMISAPFMAIGGIMLALSKDRALTLVFVVAMPILALVIGFIASKGLPRFRKIQVKIDRVNLVLREKLTGIRVIRAFNQTRYERQRFDEANRDLTDNYIKINRIMAFMMPSMMLVMNVTALAILWFGMIRIDSGSMGMGALVAFTQYSMQIMFSMVMLSMMFIMVPRAQAAAVRVLEILDAQPDIKDPQSPVKTSLNRGYVEFRNVTFHYAGAEAPAISNVSFSAGPGEVTAIIGSTGAGKSTILNLIPRFYDTISGEVLVDGVDVRKWSLESLRHKIGYVPQKPVLFSGSIEDNLRYGRESANASDLSKAAEIAQASDFITEFERGYVHQISQGGTNLSGGQKQRLSIARALVRNPEIYLFDDSFSALDFKTDSKLRTALKPVTREATVILVAQRVGTVIDADRIVVMEEGKVAGIGTHQELLANCPVYREIVLSQLSEEEIA